MPSLNVFFWLGGGVPSSNAGCHEKPKAAWRLFVTSLWWFQKHTLLSLPGCRSPAEAFSLPERAITMHRRAAAVMSQAIQGHPRCHLPNGLFQPPPALSPPVFLLLIHRLLFSNLSSGLKVCSFKETLDWQHLSSPIESALWILLDSMQRQILSWGLEGRYPHVLYSTLSWRMLEARMFTVGNVVFRLDVLDWLDTQTWR